MSNNYRAVQIDEFEEPINYAYLADMMNANHGNNQNNNNNAAQVRARTLSISDFAMGNDAQVEL